MSVLKLYSFVTHSRKHICDLLSTIGDERYGLGGECSVRGEVPPFPIASQIKWEMLRRSLVNCVLRGVLARRGDRHFGILDVHICLDSMPDLSPVPIWARENREMERQRQGSMEQPAFPRTRMWAFLKGWGAAEDSYLSKRTTPCPKAITTAGG